jgi:hypothetical protein
MLSEHGEDNNQNIGNIILEEDISSTNSENSEISELDLNLANDYRHDNLRENPHLLQEDSTMNEPNAEYQRNYTLIHRISQSYYEGWKHYT